MSKDRRPAPTDLALVKDLRQRVPLSEGYLRRRIRQGHIAAAKEGRIWLIPTEEIDAYVESIRARAYAKRNPTYTKRTVLKEIRVAGRR